MSGLFLSNKDVQRITGKGSSAAQVLISKIKASVGKPKYVNITLREFCRYTGLEEEEVQERR